MTEEWILEIFGPGENPTPINSKGEIASGVSGHFSAAHLSTDGVMHGHTWTVTVWISGFSGDAVALRDKLDANLSLLDHRILPNLISSGEDIAKLIGLKMQADEVVVSREPERIFARWRA